MSGVPRRMEMKKRTTYCRGLKRDMRPKHTSRPSGSDSSSVSVKIRHVEPRPLSSWMQIMENDMVSYLSRNRGKGRRSDFAVLWSRF